MIITDLYEAPQLCPECGGISFSDLILAEKKDACYYKVKASAKVWPSAYASGRLVQCRKKGAANYGNKNESEDDNFGKPAAMMKASPEALKIAQSIMQQQADKNVIGQAKIAGAVPSQGMAEGSNELYQKAIRKYAQQVANDYLGGGNDYLYGANKFDSEMFGVDPKQAQQDFKTLFAQLTKQQGVAEGSNDTIYPNAEVIKSKNGKPVGEIYQDGNSWGAFHYRADRGYDLIDSREDAIEALRDLHQETGRSRPDYTIKGVAEGMENSPVADAMFARLQQRPDLLRRYGVEYVIQAVHDVADSVGAVDEIGSSDVSGYMRQLEWNLKNKLNQYDEPMGDIDRLEETNDEKIAGRHDPKDFDAMVGRLKQLAGAGPLKTVWDEKKRVYRNVPTAQQPNKSQ